MSRLDVKNLTMRFGDRLIQEGIDFSVESGTVFAIMGGSGCGKSTLLKHMIGLLCPYEGQVLIDDEDYWAANEAQQRQIRQRFGVLFQSAALWTSMSVLDNVIVPLELKSPDMAKAERRDRALELLSWVGMEDAADKRPSDLSGGMKKRAGLARAIAGEPDFLFFDRRSGPDQFRAAGQAHHRPARPHRCRRADREPRARKPAVHRRRRHLPGRREQAPHRARQTR